MSRRVRPVLGPALSFFGTTLWAYVVLGQFTTSWLSGEAPLGGGKALALLAVATTVAWAWATRRSVAASGGAWGTQGAGVALVGALFFVCAVASAVVPVVGTGQGGGPIDLLVTGYLIGAAGLAVLLGGRFTFSARPVRTRRQRLVAALVWVGVIVTTLVACAELGNE